MDRRKFMKLIGGAVAAAVAAPTLLAAQVATPTKAMVPVLHPIEQPLYDADKVVTFSTNEVERARLLTNGTWLIGSVVAGAAVRSAATEPLMSSSFQPPVSRGARRAMLLGSSTHERQRSQAVTSRGFPS